jgi:hypothetical protein
MFDLEQEARAAARIGDEDAAQEVAERASVLADDLETVRRSREIRIYRGAAVGHVDDIFLMDSRLTVNMPFVGRGGSDVNAAGWLRSAQYYWEEMVGRFPEAFSPDNFRRIRGDPPLSRPVSPINDAQFRAIFSQYDVEGLRSRPLIHHHIGGGGQAAAIPAPLHPGFGGIHNVERGAGVWGREDPITEVLERLLERETNQ